MALTIPPAVAYQSPIVSQPDAWAQKPVEGPRLIPFEVLWGSMGGSGAQKCIAFNVGNSGQGSADRFSRVNALSVDNSRCGCSVRFVFPDTGETISIPAYAPRTIVPVFTNSTSFYLLTVGEVLSADETRFAVHNTLPPPIAVPFTQEQAVVASGALPVVFPSTNTLLAAGNAGTIENGNIDIINTIQGGGAWVGTFTLRDGTNKILARAICNGDGANDFYENALLWTVNGVHLRFSDGLFLDQTIIGATAPVLNQAFVNVNLYYRTP